ncbi:hypothetical protein UlMin_004325 [Ulmus minor]
MFLLFPWCLGSQAVVSFVLEKELSIEPFSLVAKEDSGDLCVEIGQETLQRITKLVNETLNNEKSYGVYTLTKEHVFQAINSGKSEGGSSGKHWVLDPIDSTKGKVVLGVLACPNLSLASIGINNQDFSQSEVGLFFAKLSGGTYMQLLDGSSPIKKYYLLWLLNGYWCFRCILCSKSIPTLKGHNLCNSLTSLVITS